MSTEPKTVPTEVKVVRQGYIIANSARVVARGENITAIDVDLKSKYGEVAFFSSHDGAPSLILDGKDTLRGDENHKKEDFTEIAFPEFAGFEVHSADFGRYNLSVCLVRE